MSSTCVHTTQTKCTELLTRVGAGSGLFLKQSANGGKKARHWSPRLSIQPKVHHEIHRRRDWVPRDNSILHHVH